MNVASPKNEYMNNVKIIKLTVIIFTLKITFINIVRHVTEPYKWPIKLIN